MKSNESEQSQLQVPRPSVGQVEVAGCPQEPPYCPAEAAYAARADVAEETLPPGAVEERCHPQGPDSTGCGVTS